jgi:hypothetical protein
MQLLAQTKPSTVSDVYMWSIILIVFIFVMWIGVTFLRKRMKQDDATGGTGFTLSDLRQLHKQGKMTAEEYEKAKAILLTGMSKPATKPVSELKPPGGE